MKSKFLRFFKLPTVVELGKSDINALPSRRFDRFETKYCWEDYEAEMKKKYPIKYFINYTLSHWFAVNIRMRIEHYIYWAKSYLIRKDHLLDLRQPKECDDWYEWGYLNPETMMLYGCFNSLKSYIHQMENSKYVKPDEEIHQEAKDIYHYWMVTRKELTEMQHALHKKARQVATKEEYTNIYKKIFNLQDEFDKKEEEMLIRLIKIRKHLWI